MTAHCSLMTDNCQRAWVEIDQGALIHNVHQIKSLLSSQTALMAVVKADAYGHGVVHVAETVLDAGASWLAIATLGEGIQLREGGITAPILVLGAINTPEEIKALVQWQLQPTLGNLPQALIFSETLRKLDKTLPVHLKLDTGMSRLGTPWQESLPFVQFVQQQPHFYLASIYSHLATADDRDLTIMTLQQQRFEKAITAITDQGITPPLRHLANSAATLINPSSHYDLVRVGLALYGLYPEEHLQSTLHLKPVLQVKARVTQVKHLPPGTGVSYGHQFVTSKTQENFFLAVVGIGYADGVPRRLSNQLKVLIRGQEVPQVGAITMDQLMLDVSIMPDLQVGEVVTLIGQDGGLTLSANDWAKALGTISWEILCGFKHRLPRVKRT